MLLGKLREADGRGEVTENILAKGLPPACLHFGAGEVRVASLLGTPASSLRYELCFTSSPSSQEFTLLADTARRHRGYRSSVTQTVNLGVAAILVVPLASWHQNSLRTLLTTRDFPRRVSAKTADTGS